MDISMRPFLFISIRTELFSTQSETLEVDDLQFGISFFQHFSYCLLTVSYTHLTLPTSDLV